MLKFPSNALPRKACALLLALFWPCVAVAVSGPDGAELYARHCAACHRPLVKTLMFDRRPSRIRSAVERIALMRPLRTLSDAEIEAIAAVLVSAPEGQR